MMEVDPSKLQSFRDEFVANVESVDLNQGGDDHQVAVGLEDGAELSGCHHQRGKTELEDGAVFAVKKKSTIDDVQEQHNVVGPVEVRLHRFEQL